MTQEEYDTLTEKFIKIKSEYCPSKSFDIHYSQIMKYGAIMGLIFGMIFPAILLFLAYYAFMSFAGVVGLVGMGILSIAGTILALKQCYRTICIFKIRGEICGDKTKD